MPNSPGGRKVCRVDGFRMTLIETQKTMKRSTLIGSLLAACLLVGSGIGNALAGETAAKHSDAKPKITKAEAKRIALGKVPHGKVKSSELEKENGELVWSFDLATPDTKDITEVLVNAKNGEVVSVSGIVTVPAKTSHGSVEIKERCSDGEVESKYYAPGVGCVKEDEPDAQFRLELHVTRPTKPVPPKSFAGQARQASGAQKTGIREPLASCVDSSANPCTPASTSTSRLEQRRKVL